MSIEATRSVAFPDQKKRMESPLWSRGLCRPEGRARRGAGQRRWAGLLLGAFGALAVARRVPGPPIVLPVRRVLLTRTPEDTMARLRGDVASHALVQDTDAAVARFAGRAGIFRYATVELVRFSAREVTFEHLHGPFRSCVERFAFVPLADGGHAVEHQGTFVMRGGLLGWLFGVLVVRGVFDRLVAAHMQGSFATGS